MARIVFGTALTPPYRLLGLANPLLAIVPFVEIGRGEDTDCGALLAQVRGAGAKVPPKR